MGPSAGANRRVGRNVFMDDLLIYALVIIGLALTSAGDTLGLGRWWRNTRLVNSLPLLK